MSHLRSLCLSLFTVVISTVIATGCTKKNAAANKNTFVYCSEASPSGFNPQLATDGPSYTASARTIYNRLVEFAEGSTQIVPSLAESWTISKDGRTYTMKLRAGVKWHSNADFTPTRDFNSDDVAFSFFRQMKEDHPYHKVSNGNYEYFVGMEMQKIIKDIKTPDSLTVVFELNQVEAPFLANLAMDFTSILSAEYADKMMAAGAPEKVDTAPIGTGPFVFQSYQKDTLIRFKSFENYFEGAPKYKNLVFSINQDPSVRFQKLKAGECHLIAEPAPADIVAMKQTANVTVYEAEGINVGYLSMNTEKSPFNRREVRQAISYALNRQAYIDAVYMGRATVAKNPFPKAIWSYNDDVKDYEYNPEKAKALLAKAGLPSGFETELWTLPVSRAYNPAGKKMGELMQADLAAIGIKVKLMTYDWPTYLEKASKGEHQLIQMGWNGDNGDPDNFMNILLSCAGVTSGSNNSRWCYKPYDQLIQEARKTPDQAKRTDLYKRAQVIIKEQAPWVTLAHGIAARATLSNVKGYSIHPLGGESFHKLTLE